METKEIFNQTVKILARARVKLLDYRVTLAGVKAEKVDDTINMIDQLLVAIRIYQLPE